jgi:hypothetical protein
MSRFFKSLRDDAQSYFGPKWHVAMFAIAAAVFWPAIVFGPNLSFDTATFTQEWVKIGISSVLLLLFFEFLSHKRESRMLSQSADTFLVNYYIAPLSSLRVALDEFYSTVTTATQTEEHAQTPSIITFWNNFEANLSLVETAPGIDSAANIMAITNRVNLVRIRNIIGSLQRLQSPDSLNLGEYKEAVDATNRLLSGFTNLRKSWQY